MMRVYTSRFRYKHYLKPSITTISDEQYLVKGRTFVQVTLTRIIPPKGTAFFQVRFWVDSWKNWKRGQDGVSHQVKKHNNSARDHRS